MTAADAFAGAQRAAGVIAAKHRGDLAGAQELLADFPDEQARTRAFELLAQLALSILRAQTGQTMDELVKELSLHIAAASSD
ncbi:superoxide dismutase [Actinoplanes sp. TRM 88003]|uniref:Superoxide dismutase n=1 Tax=Paractinoplanes aksuensis TaxID=2939490 RepID=A0ABT1DGU0_9ACTN|nr:superoxide dismutase [Actinoplanes aksuensis]MCO8269286.1 superoxide dismutase [Actinoplanes aksuensis]